MNLGNPAESEIAAGRSAAEVNSGSAAKISTLPSKASNTSSTDTSAEAVPSVPGPKRARRRLLALRKHPALKIDAECTTESTDSCDDASETREAQLTHTEKEDAGDSAGDAKAVPWWVLEYKCPPPGHLGAHHVALGAAKDNSALDASTVGPADSEKRNTPQNRQAEQRTTGLQPVRKLLGESLGARLRTKQQLEAPEYSPSQKRKMDASALSPATEPKRLREPPASIVQRVTPSNLVRPLDKIDIHCQLSDANSSVSPEP